jgi:hypothetical protein
MDSRCKRDASSQTIVLPEQGRPRCLRPPDTIAPATFVNITLAVAAGASAK